MDKNRFEVRIEGSTYVLRTDKSKEETDKIVQYANDKLVEAKNTINRGGAAAMTLALINMADENLDLKATAKDQEKNHLLEEKAQVEKEDLLEELKEMKQDYYSLAREYDKYKEEHKEADYLIMDLKEKIFELELELESYKID